VKDVAIVTDSSADLSPDTAEALDVHVVPMVTYANEGARPFCTGQGPDVFWADAPGADPRFPVRTAQPTPGDFCRVYRDIVRDAPVSCIISIHPSEQLSATVQSARLAADRITETTVLVIDSQMVGPPAGHAVKEASLAGEDHTGEEIMDFLYSLLSDLRVCVYAAALGELTQLEPEGWWNRLVRGVRRPLRPNIFELNEGEFRPAGRVRDAEEAMERLAEFASDSEAGSSRSNFAGSMFAGPEPDPQFTDRVREIVPSSVEVEEFIIGPVLGAHLGRGSMGVFTVAR